MQFKFYGHIPSSKNRTRRSQFGAYLPKDIKDFKASIKLQVQQRYYQLIEQIKFAEKPLHLVLDIVQWKNAGFDFDNKITTVQDCLFGIPKRSKAKLTAEKIGALNLDDDHTLVKFHPGDVTIDKVNLQSPADDYFIVKFVKKPVYELLDSF